MQPNFEPKLCLTPGPAVLFVVSHEVSRGGRSASAESEPASPGWRALAPGFALQTANPKAIVFFIAFGKPMYDFGRNQWTSLDQEVYA